MQLAPHLTRLNNLEDIDAISKRWRTLLGPRRQPYFDPTWYQLWWRSFGQDDALWLLHLTHPQEAIIPLMQKDGQLRWIGNIYSHRQAVATRGEQELVWESLLPFLEGGSDWDSVLLDHLPSNSPEATALRMLCDENWCEKPGEIESWAILQRPEDASTTTEALAHWHQHLDARGRNARKKRRRVQSRLEALGDLTFSCATTPAQARDFIRDYFRILNASWKPPELRRDFFRGLAQEAAKHGSFCSFVLHHHEQPIACQMGFLCGPTYYAYKTAYHQQYAAISPGLAVMDWGFAMAVERGAQRLDLLTGAAPYKQLWCNQLRPQVSFQWGTSRALPTLPSRQKQEPQTQALRASREAVVTLPSPAGEIIPLKQLHPVQIAVAMGDTRIDQNQMRRKNKNWIGWALLQEQRVQEALWLERRGDLGILHLPTTHVRCNRHRRQSFLSHCLRKEAPSQLRQFEVKATTSQHSLFDTLGFQEVTSIPMDGS